MDYNSELKDGSDLNSVKISQSCKNDERSLIPDYYVNDEGEDGCMDDNGLRAWFEQVLSFFLKEVSVNKNDFRPLPPKLGDGQDADLFKLFLTVRRIGNYESVSENNMWEFVANECGLELRIISSLKLIYVKYLKELDQWLIQGGDNDEKTENVELCVIEKLDFLSHQLDGYKSSESNPNVESLGDGGLVGFEDITEKKKAGTLRFNQNEEVINLDDIEFSVGDDKRCELSPENVVKKVGLSMINDDDNVVYDNVKKVKKVVSLQKRKREEESLPLSEMVDWIANAAKDPHNIVFETLRRSCKWKKYTIDKLWKQALLTKQALFAQLNTNTSNEASCSQKKNQRMHPSMYEDDRVSSRDCILRTSSRMKRHRTEPTNFTTNRIHETVKPRDQDYNLGPLYQANVPVWTGPVHNIDPKWLGTQMWARPDEPKDDSVTIGLGRESPYECECPFRGSAECVNFHIAENRFKLKIELGPFFYKWGFNQMGEEVSLPWEPEEEKRFKRLVVKARQELGYSNKSRYEIMNKFWKRASEMIPDKPKHKLVSYYFNVFVLRRRSYQNRVTPRDVDSDNDEEEVGSVGDRFGYEKIHMLSVKCLENLQCTEVEY